MLLENNVHQILCTSAQFIIVHGQIIIVIFIGSFSLIIERLNSSHYGSLF